jgi:hypothetical protein
MKAENKEINPSPSQEINEYKIKEKIKVYDTVLKSLMKFSNNSSNGNVDGILFGHETDNSIVISHAFPLEKNHTQDDIINIVRNIIFYLNFKILLDKLFTREQIGLYKSRDFFLYRKKKFIN